MAGSPRLVRSLISKACDGQSVSHHQPTKRASTISNRGLPTQPTTLVSQKAHQRNSRPKSCSATSKARRQARRNGRRLHRRRRRRRRRRRLVLRRGLPEPSGGAGLVHHPTTALSPTDRAEDSLKAAEHHGRGSKLAGASAVLAFGEVKAVKGVPAKTRDSLTFSLRALPDCILFVYLVAY